MVVRGKGGSQNIESPVTIHKNIFYITFFRVLTMPLINNCIVAFKKAYDRVKTGEGLELLAINENIRWKICCF